MNSSKNDLLSLPARHRYAVLILLLLLTAWLGSHALKLTMQPGFLNELPTNHPYATTFHQYNPLFGGSNVVVITLHQPDGHIYTAPFLNALRDLTGNVLHINGVDPATVRSLFTGNVTYREVTEFGFDGSRVIPKVYTGSADQVEAIRKNVTLSREIGRSVALDQQGALIRFELVERDPKTGGQLNYREVGIALEQIRNTYQQAGLEVRIIGFAPLVLAVMAATKQVIMLLAGSWLILMLVVTLKTRRPLVALAITGAPALALVWQLGGLKLLGHSIDPLAMLTPFLTYLLGVTIALLLYKNGQGGAADNRQKTCSTMLRQGGLPTTLALVTVMGTLSLSLFSDVPLISNFVVSGLVGAVALWFALLVALPNLLSFSTPAEPANQTVVADKSQVVTAAVVVILIASVGAFARTQMRIGDYGGSGATQLSSGSQYNQDISAVLENYRFGVDQITLIAKAAPDGCLEFDVLDTIDQLTWRLRDLPEVRSVFGLPVYMKLSTIGHHEGFLRFFGYAREARANSVNTWGTELRDKLYDQKCGTMPLRIYPVDHAGTTLTRILDTAKQFAAEHADAPVQFEFAIGNASIRAAANDRVPTVEARFLLGAAAMAVLAIGLFSLSPVKGLFSLLLLVASASGIYPALLLLNQGLNLTTLPAIALALCWSLTAAAFASLAIDREQVCAIAHTSSFAALATAFALLPWVFSDLRYQAETGTLLALLLLWFAAINRYLLPRLWRGKQT